MNEQDGNDGSKFKTSEEEELRAAIKWFHENPGNKPGERSERYKLHIKGGMHPADVVVLLYRLERPVVRGFTEGVPVP